MCPKKSTYLITALQGQVTDLLHGVRKGATYEETLEVLEDLFGDEHLAAESTLHTANGIQGNLPRLERIFHDTDPGVAPTENMGIHRQCHE
jgi:hypothetical protein